MVGEQHRALRVALGAVQQRTKAVARITAVGGEPRGDVLGQVVGSQRTEDDRCGLAEEGVPAVGEQVAHQTRM